jgi:hypothetical protein
MGIRKPNIRLPFSEPVSRKLMSRHRQGRIRTAALLLILSSCATTTEGSEADFGAYLASASEYQEDILADGVVTAGEYEGAILATKQCIEDVTDGRIEVSEPFPSPDGVGIELELGWRTGDTDDEEERISEIAREASFSCSDEYSTYVDQAYRDTHKLSAADIDRDLAAFADCLHFAGFEQFSESSNRVDFERYWSSTSNENSAAIGRCVDAHSVGYSNLPTEDE